MAYYHPYGVKYQGEFSSIPMKNGTSIDYQVSILKKYYNGVVSPLTFAAEPVVHTFLEDDPKPPIKGSELELTIINLNGEIKLTDFYSEQDDEYQIIFKKKNGKTIFVGYLIQDDCEEIQTDIAHEISLTFSDQLALLKDIPFDLGCKQVQSTLNGFTEYNGFFELPTTTTFQLYGNRIIIFFGTVSVGNSIILEIDGKTIGVYKIQSIENVFGGAKYLYVDEQLPVYDVSGYVYGKFYILDSLDFNANTTLATIISICVSNTGLRVDDSIMSSELLLKDHTNYTGYEILQMLNIFPSSFRDENDYDSCYDVLEKIMIALGATIFQANGVWNIVRYNDLRYADNYITGLKLNTMFTYSTSYQNIRIREIGNGEDIEYGINSSIVRPLKSVVRQFNYDKIELINNANLVDTGNLVGSIPPNIKRYNLQGWSIVSPTPANTIFIHYEYGPDNNIIDKYIYIVNTTLPTAPLGIKFKSNDIIVKANDKSILSLEYRHQTGTPNNTVVSQFKVILTDGVQTKYFCNDGIVPIGWYSTARNVNITSELTNGDWNDFDLEIYPFPFDGVLHFEFTPFGLGAGSGNGNLFTKFKNFELDYKNINAGSYNAIGQRHTNKWYNNIKNDEKIDIHIDTVVSPGIKGTLYTLVDAINGQNYYAENFRESIMPNIYKLGQIIVGQEHNWRDRIRIKFEFNAFAIDYNEAIYGETFVNPLTVIKYLNTPNKSYAFGKLELRYKSNMYNGTLYEMWDSVLDEKSVEKGISADPSKIYNFEYLYNNK